jgi:dihydrofolate synthase / folylpolyglutamate synthase
VNAPLTGPLAKLYTLAPRGALLGLDRVQAAARKLGDLHRVGTYAHIAGTNGKGSTAAFVSTMATQAGARVGLFTSPHLCRFAERIQINGRPIDDDTLAASLEAALSVADDLTFFEVATLAALHAFRQARVDLSVLEVGLGGRLDATNVVEGNGVQAVTRVAFDHIDRLGTSLAAIAREKAGILRGGSLCVVGRLHPDALAVVEQTAGQVGAKVYEATGDEEGLFVEAYPPSLPGAFQRNNAMVAVAIARGLGIPEPAIAQGLVSTQWPGRCEVIETAEGFVLLDCAHNADGALALKNTLLGFAASLPRRNLGLVFGSMADKNWQAMLERLSQVVGPRVYIEPPGREPAKATDMAAYLDGEIALGIGEALSTARQRVGRGGLVVVTGSIYLVGQVRAYLLGLRCDPHVGL